MKARPFAVALVLTSLALASGPLSATTLCPADSCFYAGQACVDNGGAPVPSTSGTCYTLPNYDQYDRGSIACWFSGTPVWVVDCYWG